MTVHVGLELSYSRRVRVYCTGFAQDGGRKWRGRGTASVGPATDSRRCPRRRCKKSICFRIGSRYNWQWPTGRKTSANAVTHKDSPVTLLRCPPNACAAHQQSTRDTMPRSASGALSSMDCDPLCTQGRTTKGGGARCSRSFVMAEIRCLGSPSDPVRAPLPNGYVARPLRLCKMFSRRLQGFRHEGKFTEDRGQTSPTASSASSPHSQTPSFLNDINEISPACRLRSGKRRRQWKDPRPPSTHRARGTAGMNRFADSFRKSDSMDKEDQRGR